MNLIKFNLFRKHFSTIKLENDLMKMSNVGVHAKNVYCCLDHIERYKSFKTLRKFLLTTSGENEKSLLDLKKNLNLMNALIRYDSDIRKLFLGIEQGKENIIPKISNNTQPEFSFVIKFLFQLLIKFEREVDELVLQNLSNFMKDIDTIKLNSNMEIIDSIILYLFQLLPHSFFENENGKYFLDENSKEKTVPAIISCLNILTSIFSNSDLNSLTENENFVKFFEIMKRIIASIISKNNDENKNTFQSDTNLELCENLIINSIINFFNSAILSRKLNNEFVSNLNEYFVNNSINMIEFVKTRAPTFNLNEIKSILVFYAEILYGLENTKLENLPNEIEPFLKNFEEFLFEINKIYGKQMKNFSFLENCFDLTGIISERLKFSKSPKNQM